MKVVILFIIFALTVGEKCNFIGFGSQVCYCDVNHCEFFGKLETKVLHGEQFIQYVTSKEGDRFMKQNGRINNIETSNKTGKIITIDHQKTYQKIFGFGGAFTDSTGINIESLKSSLLRENLLKSYFGKEGIGYTVGRVPIGGTDFSLKGYTYDDHPGDEKLEKFNLTDADYNYKIPLMKRAMELTNNEIKFFGSAWSPPAWMKTNNQLSGMGFLLQKHYSTWANYYVKFLKEYKKNGIKFWGLTTANEPTVAVVFSALINSLVWSFPDFQRWIRDYFGPTVKSYDPDIKLLIWDDQRYLIPLFPNQIFNDSYLRDLIYGTAVHWYEDQYFPASLLTDLHNSHPDKVIISTEACIIQKPSLGNWTNAELYAKDIIEILQNYGIGWIDWNMALNLEGGPTYIGNYVDSPIIVDAELQIFYKQPMYYILGHFSKFILRNSIRIHSTCDENVMCVAFLRPDNLTVIVIFNEYAKNHEIQIRDKRKKYFNVVVTRKSITTILY